MDCVLPESELDLLAKLEEANRRIETDSRSLNSLVNHSRRDSDTSQISFSNDSNNNHNNNNSANTSIGPVSITGSSDKSFTSATRNGSGGGIECEGNDVDDEDEETHSWQQWGELISDWQTNWKRKRAQITALIRRNGIPHHFRALVWQLLCQIDSETPERKSYANYIRARSACEKVIRRDIARTYPEHEFFKEKDGVGQESLFNVMKAYSLHDREVGYCQGSAFIVGLLLMQMPEEETFAVLVHIMQKYRMRDMFKPSMAELGLCMFQLECLVQEQLPQLHLHFKSQNFHTTMYASGWFLTLFTTTLSLPLACRVMDVFLVDGMQIIFQISLALLTIGERDLIVRDMEGMLQYFQKDLPAIVERDEDGGTRLMRMASEIVWNSRKMRKLEKEYQTLKIKEQQEVLELKRLRTEVRQWRQRCELLEAESARLAQRLIQGQVSRAEEVEMTFALETELSKLRNERLDMMHNLEMAYEEIRMLSMRLQETLSETQRFSSIVECSASLPATTIQTTNENGSGSGNGNGKNTESNNSADLVTCLQDELVKVRLREAENDEMIRDLQAKIDELETEVRMLREPKPDNNLARIQEELMAVKLREAESNLSLKDLRERIDELRCQWHNMLNERTNGGGCLSAHEQLEDSLMSAKLNEIAAVGEVKELNLKVIQLESQVQLTANQFRRQSDELKKLKDDLDESQKREQQLDGDLKRQRFAYADLESCLNEHRIQAGISSAEKDQQIAELTQRISQLELKNDEMVAESELNQNSLEQNEQICDLQDKVVELKAQFTSSTSTTASSYPLTTASTRVTNKLPTTTVATAITKTISISNFTNNTPLPTPDLEAWRWIE